MFKNLLITSLALLGAGTASAAVVDGEASQKMRVVIIWGDEFAAGDSFDAMPAPTGIDLNGSGAFFGASGLLGIEDRTPTWGPHTFQNGLSSSRTFGGYANEWGSGIAFMGKRLTGDYICVINLASPGADVNPYPESLRPAELARCGRYPRPVVNDLGQLEYPLQTTEQGALVGVRADMRAAVAGLQGLCAVDTEFELSGIVFSCWNNATQAYYKASNFDSIEDMEQYLQFANVAAKEQCEAMETLFRSEFALAYGGSSFLSLSSAAPKRVAYKRHATYRGGHRYGRDLNLGIYRAQTVELDLTSGLGMEDLNPYKWDVEFVEMDDSIEMYDPAYQSGGRFLSPAARNYIAMSIGITLFN